MRILGIETSCDECSLSVVEDGNTIKGLVVYSQLKEHNEFGGIVPELASRLHIKYIDSLYDLLCEQMGLSHTQMKEYIDGIAVTVCPGLSGSLMVGLHYAKGLAISLNKPLIGIDHMQAHFYSAILEHDIAYPYMASVISGGHTLLAIVHDYDNIEVKGASIDDACGEAFEKIAREFSLGYPGGPAIDKLAQKGSAQAAQFPIYSDPKQTYNFSYSGLKTAVIHHRDKYWNSNYPQTPEHIAAAFQYAAIQMVLDRIHALSVETGMSTLALGGGVACNSYLRTRLQALLVSDTNVPNTLAPQHKQQNNNIQKFFTHTKAHDYAPFLTQVAIPSPKLCADNAAMIAGLGYQYLCRGLSSDLNIGVHARQSLYRG